jgi:hypothetical protein
MAEKRDNSYQGWKNWETWLVNLHFMDSFIFPLVSNEKYIPDETLIDIIKFHIHSKIEGDNVFANDMIYTFFGKVDWRELFEYAKERV